MHVVIPAVASSVSFSVSPVSIGIVFFKREDKPWPQVTLMIQMFYLKESTRIHSAQFVMSAAWAQNRA